MRARAAIIGGFAALLCTAASPTHAQFVPHWQGLYLGVNVGLTHGRTSFDASDLAVAGIASPASIRGLSMNGAAVGLGGGLNWQSGPLVFGLEGDWSRHSLHSDVVFAGTIPPFGAVTGTLGTELAWLASARARAGIAAGRALFYGTAGFAVARAGGEVVILGPGAPAAFSDDILLAGWVLGGGIEYALSPNWSLKGELIRTHIGTGLFSAATAGVPISSSIDLYNLRAGLNYKF